MKIFNRLLAMLLALVTVLAILPMSVFADVWLDVEANKNQSGNVTENEVTVTLDAKALLSYLKDRDLSGLLKDGITVDGLKSILTTKEFFEILPKKNFTNLFNAIIDDIDVDVLLDCVDPAEIVDMIDPDALIDLIKELDDIESYVTDYDALMGYIADDKLADALDAKDANGKPLIDTEKLISNNISALMDLALGLSTSDLLAIVLIDEVMKLEGVKFEELVNLDYVKNTVTYRKLLDVYVDMDLLPDYLTGLEAYVNTNFTAAQIYDYVIEENINGLLEERANQLADYVDMGALQTLLSGKTYADFKACGCVTESKLIDLISAKPYSALESFIDDEKATEILEASFAADQLYGYWNIGGNLLDVGAMKNDGLLTSTHYQKMIDQNAINVTAMIVGNNKLWTVEDLKNAGAVDITKMVSGANRMFTADDLMEANVIDSEVVLSGTATLPPLFTAKELVEKDVVDIPLMVSGDSTKGIPALLDPNDLVAKGIVDIPELIEYEVIYVDELADAYGYDNLVKIEGDDGLKAVLKGLPDKSKLTACIPDKPKAVKTIGVSKVVSTIGGYKKLLDNYVTDFNALIEVLGFEDILEAVIDDGKLNSVFDVNKLVTDIGLQKIIDLIGTENIQKIISDLRTNGGLEKILNMFDFKSYLKYVQDMIADLEENIQEVTLAGKSIIYKDEYGFLVVDASALLSAVADLAPTFADIEKIDPETGIVFSLAMGLTYVADGTNTEKTKNVTINFALDGGIDYIKTAARKLQAVLDKVVTYDISKDGIYLELKLPSKFASAIRKVLESDTYGPAVRDEYLAMFDSTISDAANFVQNLPLDKVIALLEKVDSADFEKAYAKIIGNQYVEIVLQYIKNRTGYDFTEYTLEDFVDASTTLPTLKTICDKIQSRTGIDVLAKLPIAEETENKRIAELFTMLAARAGYDVDFQKILVDAANSEDPIQALYDLALDKASNSGAVYTAVKSRLVALVNRLLATRFGPKLNQYTLSDIYDGNSLFGGDKTVEFSPKVYIEKAFNKVLAKLSNRFDVSLGEDIADIILSYISDSTVTYTFGAAVRVNGLYNLSVIDEQGKLMGSTFLPQGTTLAPFLGEYKPADGVSEFLGWVEYGTVNKHEKMPAKDVVLAPSLKAPVIIPEKEYTVTIIDPVTFEVLATYVVKSGATLADYADEIEALVSGNPSDILYTYHHVWKTEAGATFSLENSPIVSDLTLTWAFEKDDTKTGLKIPGMIEGVDYRIEYVEEEHAYHVILLREDGWGEELKLQISKAFLSAWALEDGGLVLNAEHTVHTAKMNKVLLQKLLAHEAMAEVDSITLAYDATVDGTIFASNVKGVASYAFGFYFGDSTTETHMTFDGGAVMTVTLPFAGAQESQTVKTFVYTIKDGVAEELAAQIDATKGAVTFTAPHFSEFAAVNKYNLTLADAYVMDVSITIDPAKLPTISGPIAQSPIATGWYAAGEELAIVAVTTNATAASKGLEYLYTRIQGGAKLQGDKFVMPAQAIVLEHVATTKVYNIYFYDAKGAFSNSISYTLFDLPTYANVNKLPDGYTATAGWRWYGIGTQANFNSILGKGDLYLFLVNDNTAKSFTMKFKANGAVTEVTHTVADWYSQIANIASVPNTSPSKAGYWVDANGKKLTDYTMADWAALFAGTATSIEFTAKYTDRVYTIVVGDGVSVKDALASAIEGTEVQIIVLAKPGMNASATWTALGDTKDLVLTLSEDGKTYTATITMPAADVTVEAAYTLKSIEYVDADGKIQTGTYGDKMTLVITVPMGATLTGDLTALSNAPAGLVLLSSEVGANGALVLTYQYTLETEGVSENAFLTEAKALIKTLEYRKLYVMNGKVYSTEAAANAALAEGETITSWSEALVNSLMFAALEYNEPQNDSALIITCIVMGVIILLLLIALLYTLYIFGKLKPNFFLKFITWLVSIFFAICMGIAAVGLAIARVFGYREEDILEELPEEPEMPEEPAKEEAKEEVAEEEAPAEEAPAEETIIPENIEIVAEAEVTEELATPEADAEATEEVAAPAEEEKEN